MTNANANTKQNAIALIHKVDLDAWNVRNEFATIDDARARLTSYREEAGKIADKNAEAAVWVQMANAILNFELYLDAMEKAANQIERGRLLRIIEADNRHYINVIIAL